MSAWRQAGQGALCSSGLAQQEGDRAPYLALRPMEAKRQSAGTLLGREACQPCHTPHKACTELRGPDMSCI